MICPIGKQTHDVPKHEVVRQDGDTYDDLSPEQRTKFDDYFVVRTAAHARRFREHTWPGITLVDEEALGRIVAGWTVDVGSLMHERPELLAALIGDWLVRR